MIMKTIKVRNPRIISNNCCDFPSSNLPPIQLPNEKTILQKSNMRQILLTLLNPFICLAAKCCFCKIVGLLSPLLIRSAYNFKSLFFETMNEYKSVKTDTRQPVIVRCNDNKSDNALQIHSGENKLLLIAKIIIKHGL